MKAINIEWDVDYPEDLENLPTEIEIPGHILEECLEEDECEEVISDYITEVTGFCHYGFNLSED